MVAGCVPCLLYSYFNHNLLTVPVLATGLPTCLELLVLPTAQ